MDDLKVLFLPLFIFIYMYVYSKLFIAMLLLRKQIAFDLVASMGYFPSTVYHVH